MNTSCAIHQGEVDTFPDLLRFAQPGIRWVVNKPPNNPRLSVAIVRSCRGGNLLSRVFKCVQVPWGGVERGRGPGRKRWSCGIWGELVGSWWPFVLRLAHSTTLSIWCQAEETARGGSCLPAARGKRWSSKGGGYPGTRRLTSPALFLQGGGCRFNMVITLL